MVVCIQVEPSLADPTLAVVGIRPIANQAVSTLDLGIAGLASMLLASSCTRVLAGKAVRCSKNTQNCNLGDEMMIRNLSPFSYWQI